MSEPKTLHPAVPGRVVEANLGDAHKLDLSTLRHENQWLKEKVRVLKTALDNGADRLADAGVVLADQDYVREMESNLSYERGRTDALTQALAGAHRALERMGRE